MPDLVKYILLALSSKSSILLTNNLVSFSKRLVIFFTHSNVLIKNQDVTLPTSLWAITFVALILVYFQRMDTRTDVLINQYIVNIV